MKIDIAGVGIVTVLFYTETEVDGDITQGVVLADRGGYQPYVTWVLAQREGAKPEAYWGHCHTDLVQAVEDFQRRTDTTWRATTV